VVVEPRTHNVIHQKAYDTSKDRRAAKRMAHDYNKLPKGSIIMVAVKEEASAKLTNGLRKVFSKMGSKEIYNLGLNECWAFIGIKGQKGFGERRSTGQVGVGMILGYSKTVRKVTKKMHVVKGGSRFEIKSAGSKDGNFASVKITNEMALAKE